MSEKTDLSEKAGLSEKADDGLSLKEKMQKYERFLISEALDASRGSIINKFRGDVAILEPGLRMIEEKLGMK